MSPLRLVQRGSLLAAAIAALAVTGSAPARLGGTWASRPARASRADCVYAANSVAVLSSFEELVRHRFDCALVFNNAAPDWANWEAPWFVSDPRPDFNWARWTTAGKGRRQLIITQNLFPSSLDGSDWLSAGAQGMFSGYARELAQNLVAAGLGHAVIRLAHEANDTTMPYAIGTTPRQWAQWREFWRRTVLAMKSVRGARFLFDWCVNAYWRPIPLRDWYPGDDVVDIVGIDAYDSGVPAGAPRWRRIYTEPDGIGQVLAFAAAHHKPVSLPEWGLAPPAAGSLGGGDDPGYIDGIAAVVRANPVAYQSYFYNLDAGALLRASPHSLAAYRRHFGARGDSVGTGAINR
jgi:hypothetical protein